MIANLPKYYSIVSINGMDEATLEKRSAAIEEIVKKKERDWILECIRYFLDKPLKNADFEQELFKAINAFDAVFLEDGTTLEKRVFAGAVVAQSMIGHKNRISVAAALRSASFGLNYEAVINSEIINNANDQLTKIAVSIREERAQPSALPKLPILGKDGEHTTETLGETVKGLIAYVKGLTIYAEQQKAFSDADISVLKEESNIQWWLFRSYSDLKEIPVSELSPNEAIFILSKELNNLIKRVPEPPNTNNFLRKNWDNVQNIPDGVSIKEAISAWYSVLRSNVQIKESAVETYGNLAPLNFACKKALELDNEPAWVGVFGKLSNLSADSVFPCFDLCVQFLHELVLFDFN